MREYGTSNPHANLESFGDLDAVDAPTKLTIAYHYKLNTVTVGGIRIPFSKGKFSAGTDKWTNFVDSSRIAGFRLASTATGTVQNNLATMPNDTGLHSIMLAFDGTASTDNIFGFIDGIEDALSPADSTASIGASTEAVRLGGDAFSSTTGLAISIGHPMVWTGAVGTSVEAAQFHAGINIPMAANLAFWAKGINDPAIDVIGGSTATETGTVTLISEIVDSFFTGQQLLDQFRHLASLDLREKRTTPATYSLRVPLEFAREEIMDLMQVSHDSLPRAESLLDKLQEHGLFTKWRRLSIRLIGIELLPGEMVAVLTFKDYERYMGLLWDTDEVIDTVSSDHVGTASIDVGATRSQNRGTRDFLEQVELGTVPRLASSGPGQILANVEPFVDMISFKGFLSQEPAKNLIQNSNFNSNFTDWVSTQHSTLSSETFIGASLNALAFVNKDISDRSAGIILFSTGSTKFAAVRQTPTVSSTDGFRRLLIYYSTISGEGKYRIQRGSSDYWDDVGGVFGSSNLWNALPTTIVGPPISAETIKRAISKPIPSTQSTTWTIHIGAAQSTASVQYYQVDLTLGRYVHTPIVTTTGSASTSQEDERKLVLDLSTSDEFRQIVHPIRGTARLRFIAEQGSTNLSSGDVLVIRYTQFSTNSSESDRLIYEKPVGSAHRFAYERYIGGSLSARATKAIAMSRDDIYEIGYRWTSTEGELGLPIRTLSIFVSTGTTAIKGVDAQSTGSHSTSELKTEMWVGAAPSTHGLLRAYNYQSRFDLQQRVLPDEEMLSGR